MIKYREISWLIFLKNLLKELKQLLKIGVPIYGSQISYMGMGVTDTIVAGRASALDLSGLAIGNALSMPFYFLLGGCLFAVTPIVAQLFGAKKYEEIGQKVREIPRRETKQETLTTPTQVPTPEPFFATFGNYRNRPAEP